VLGRKDSASAGQWFGVILIDDGLFHLPHLVENSCLFLPATAVRSVVILLIFGSSKLSFTTRVDKLLSVGIEFEAIFFEPVDCEGLLEEIAGEGRRISELTGIVFSWFLFLKLKILALL
jgi:hypothetical protein